MIELQHSGPLNIIGLMSGTSADGVDAAFVTIQGVPPDVTLELRAWACFPFASELRETILAQCDPGRSSVDCLCVLSVALAEEYALASHAVAEMASCPLGDVAAIACHGQTVWHQPNPLRCGTDDHRGTLQIGNAAVLAARTGCTVVSDFRSADMAVGGQGAPLIPFADWALLSSPSEVRAVQNIGGIANVTYMPPDGRLDDIVAFDTGPGNMVIDAVAAALTDGARACDEGGAWAAMGKPSATVIAEIVENHAFFRRPPPKSTGREEFGQGFVRNTFLPACAAARLSGADIVATATALTAETIADAYRRWLPQDALPETIIVGGGGARNLTLMHMLSARLSPARLTTHEEFGIPDDAKEAIGFALLGYETLCGRASNVPSATGAAYRAVLGSITPAPRVYEARRPANAWDQG